MNAEMKRRCLEESQAVMNLVFSLWKGHSAAKVTEEVSLV